MLPSNGHFKSIRCPYDKAKLCVRPFCHYWHDPRNQNDLGENVDAIEDTEYLFDTNLNSNLRLHSKSTYLTDNAAEATYVPTPVDKCVKPPGILKTNNSTLDRPSTFVPVYNPTPISKLKELNTAQPYFNTYNYSPEYTLPTRRKKKIEEYDPTEVKCISKRTVRFADQPEVALHNDYAPAFSSEDELDDPSNAPAFSDDDMDDDVQIVAPPKAVEPVPVEETKAPEKDELDEKKIDEFSLVDKIIVDSKKNEKFLTMSSKLRSTTSKPPLPKEKPAKDTDSKKSEHTELKEPKIDVTDVYNCDLDIITLTDSNDSIPPTNNIKKSKSKDIVNLSNKLPSNHSDLIKSKSDTVVQSKDSKSNSNKKFKSNSSDESKSKEKSSKVVKSDKIKKSEEKSKVKSNLFISDKSSSKKSSKESKTEKHKSTVPSSNSEKSSSSSKISKTEKGKSNDSKLAKTKEVKLQDEKVSSSNTLKKNKHEQSSKHSKSSDTHLKQKSKPSHKDKFSTKHESSNKKTEKFQSGSDSEKHSSKHKSSVNFLKKTIPVDDNSSDDNSMDDGTLSSDSESEEERRTEECLKIFEESFPEIEKSSFASSGKEHLSSEEKEKVRDLTILRKKRFAHPAAENLKKKSSHETKKVMQPLNPGQVMLNRYAQMKSLHAEQSDQKDKMLAAKRVVNSPGRGPEKKRICFAPNQSLLAAIEEKNKMNQSMSNDFSPLPPTVSKTLKVTKRVAHVPDAAVKPRPIIPMDYGSKVPTVIRQKYLNAFIDEFLKFSPTEDEAYENALEEEKKAYQRSSSKAIYMNVASNTLNRLRHMKDNDSGKKTDGVSSTTSSTGKTVSHESMLNGPLAQRTSFSIERKKAAPTLDLKGVALYEQLSEYILTEDQLKENGFPWPHPTEIGRAVISGIYSSKTQFCNDPFKRTCCRCQKTYYVNVDGEYVRDEECDFHWGRLWKKRIAGAFESRYSCCQGDSESDGCCVSPGHVFEGSEAHALKGFVNTFPKTPPPDNYYGIYALDCEMCYTTAGIELTRVSIIGPDLKPAYESFVRPQNKVLDYNTRFSGITEENLKDCKTNLRDVQAVLLLLFNEKTILIGHSLESDLKALKLFHKTVIDTSVVFPHKMGLPYKRALRTLMAEKLNKIIQNDVGGHDSIEDAVSCMELMIWKIKEDLKGVR